MSQQYITRTSPDGTMIYLTDHYGMTTKIPAGMERPAQCTCGQVYDLNAVHVTGRHADCSVWRAPCCNREADDRIWNGGHNGYTELLTRNRT